MDNKIQNELLRGISGLDINAVQRQLKKGANPNFEYPKELLNQVDVNMLSDFYTPLELLFLFQNIYNAENPKLLKNKESELKIASLLLENNANPKPALDLATQIFGKFSSSNVKKSGCKELWSKLFYQYEIFSKNYSILPKSLLNELLSSATLKFDFEDMERLLESGANPKYKQLKLDEMLIQAVIESLEKTTEIDQIPDSNELEKIQFLLQLGANPNYKIPKKVYPRYSYQSQPFSALRLLVFSISDALKINTNRDQELEIAKLLLDYGADAICAMKLAKIRYGNYNPNNELDFGQKLLNLIASKIEVFNIKS